MIKEAIESVVSGKSLSFEQASAVMEEIMAGQATPTQIAALITALRIKGETVDEIAGLATVMRSKAVPVETSSPVVDTCGTGGDGACSFNISTAAAFVAAGAGLRVAKHGNRAMSSHCGSADVLEALGVKIDLNADGVARCLETVGIGFMFAQTFHPAMKYASATRREIGIRTVFNILGPLTNPARAEAQVIGVPNRELGAKMAAALQRMGTKHSMVVHSLSGMDELSTSGKSMVWEVNCGVLPVREVSASDFGFKESKQSDLKGGTAAENAEILRRILDGEPGPRREVVVMTAGAVRVVGGCARDFNDGARLAEKAIDSGKAKEKLEGLVKVSQGLK
jgi:anthranilate phosphoribosyltransferase